MDKYYNILLKGNKFIITYCKSKISISCEELKKTDYLDPTDVFNAIRKKISEEFLVEKSNIRLTFEKDVQDKIFNIAEENMEKLKKKAKRQ